MSDHAVTVALSDGQFMAIIALAIVAIILVRRS